MFNPTFKHPRLGSDPQSKPSRCVKYSSTTRFIKNETYRGPPSFIYFDYRNKRQKNERLKHGGRAVLYLSRRFVAICFVTNKRAPVEIPLSSCWESGSSCAACVGARAVTNHRLPGLFGVPAHATSHRATLTFDRATSALMYIRDFNGGRDSFIFILISDEM